MTETSWSPASSPATLRARAALNIQLRDFFRARNILEVDVPVLGRCAALDPHIASIAVVAGGGNGDAWLQSSPEYFMKRLLAAGSGDIYSLGKAFRDAEQGARHNPEFTMLEWYRLGLDEHQLMAEVEALLRECLQLQQVQYISYRQLFESHLGIDPHSASSAELKALALLHVDADFDDADCDLWLNLLMSHVIEPAMGDGLLFVFDYPASQAALARVAENQLGQPVARRFEAYVDGLELANGYWELTDPAEQRRRFDGDRQRRRQAGLPVPQADAKLLQAMEAGLPDCAGVALGVDRLLMCQLGIADIREVLAFPFERC